MDKLSAILLRCYLCLQSNTTCIPIPDKWSCHYCLLLGEGCIFIPPIPNNTGAALLSRNCVECISSQHRCKFIDPISNKCTRCTKMNVKCYFKFSERGRRNDLHPQNNIHLTPAQDSSDVSHTLPKLSDQNGRSVNANESVHNHHSINGESCHSHSCVEPVTHFDSGGVISTKCWTGHPFWFWRSDIHQCERECSLSPFYQWWELPRSCWTVSSSFFMGSCIRKVHSAIIYPDADCLGCIYRATSA